MANRRKQSKYGNQKVRTPDGVFDSQREYARWGELRILERAGEIQELRRQVPFELIPAIREPDTVGPRGGVKRGKVIEKGVVYIADFVYEDCGGMVVEDSKGHRTPDYVIKRKLMLWVHGIRVKEV